MIFGKVKKKKNIIIYVKNQLIHFFFRKKYTFCVGEKIDFGFFFEFYQILTMLCIT